MNPTNNHDAWGPVAHPVPSDWPTPETLRHLEPAELCEIIFGYAIDGWSCAAGWVSENV